VLSPRPALTSGALLHQDMSSLSREELDENRRLIEVFETEARWRFPEGYARDKPSARLTVDPVFATQRPFFMYGTIIFLNTLCHLVLRFYGFQRKSQYDTPAQAIYHRPAAAPVKTAVAAAAADPIIFVHGIGIGFVHYLMLLLSLPRDVDVYLVEWPHVAYQMSDRAPTIDEAVDTFTRMLDDGGHAQVMPRPCQHPLCHSLCLTYPCG